LNSTTQQIVVTSQGTHQSSQTVFNIPRINPYNSYSAEKHVYNITDLIRTVNTQIFNNPTAYQHVSFYGSNMQYDPKTETITLILKIQTILANPDYRITFVDDNQPTVWTDTIWYTKLGIADPSYALADPSDHSPINHVRGTIPALDRQVYITRENNYFTLKPAYDPLGGVYINTVTNPDISNITTGISAANDIVIHLSNLTLYQYYTISDVINEINQQFTYYQNQYGNILYGSSVSINPATNHAEIRLNVNMAYTTKDYVLDFFDVVSYTQCHYGANKSVQAAKWDTTLGWLLGFHSESVYELTPANLTTDVTTNTTYYKQFVSNPYTYDTTTNIANIRGDIAINVNIYNYFMLILDDYTQSHINDGLVTITKTALDVPLNSYAIRNNALSISCLTQTNPTTATATTSGITLSQTASSNAYKQYIPSQTNAPGGNNLTNNQLYAINQTLNVRNTQLQNPFQTTYGAKIQDIFGIIPLKTTGLQVGQSYVEFGGTLQNQDRVFFGPVNIKRITVRLITDKGVVLNLNNANWSFSLIIQQLYTSSK